jgi:predicted MPP superfamily phosphohydrolase
MGLLFSSSEQSFTTEAYSPPGPRLARLVERWQRGGVEDYGLGLSGRRPNFRRRKNSIIDVTQHTVRLQKLPREFSGLRILHLTDIHHSLYFSQRAVLEAVELANQLQPDLVVLTGDYITYSRAFVEPAAELLASLRARLGVYAVLGNHDFRVGADAVTRAFRRRGIEVLRNRHTVLRAGSRRLTLAGVDDISYHADVTRALRGAPGAAPAILLSHSPAILPSAARHGVGLVLSGHTHGGQVRLPILDRLLTERGKTQRPRRPRARWDRFQMGWYRQAETLLYISRGIGTVVVPLRLGCPPEMPLFTLEPGGTAQHRGH